VDRDCCMAVAAMVLARIGMAGETGAEVGATGGWYLEVWVIADADRSIGMGSMRLLIDGEALARLITFAGGETGGALFAAGFDLGSTVAERTGSKT
jgi:hypothetical protein